MTYVNEDAAFALAAIGSVRMVAKDDPVPEGWHECDGSRQFSANFPDFVRKTNVTGAWFTLPKPERELTGKFIIKLW